MLKHKIVFLTFIFLSISINTYSQRREITGKEFLIAKQTAEQKSNIFPKRHTIKEESYLDNKLVKNSILIWEAISNEKQRIIKTEQIGSKFTKLETIEIGFNVYKRENDGQWKKEEWRFKHGLTRQLLQLINCSEIWIEENIIENQAVTTYISFQINKDNERLVYEEKRYWIGSNGLLLKQETTDGLLNPRNVIRYEVTTYEYDANIKIEAPIK